MKLGLNCQKFDFLIKNMIEQLGNVIFRSSMSSGYEERISFEIGCIASLS